MLKANLKELNDQQIAQIKAKFVGVDPNFCRDYTVLVMPEAQPKELEEMPIPSRLQSLESDLKQFWEPIGNTAQLFWFKPRFRSRSQTIENLIRQKLADIEIELAEHYISCKASNHDIDSFKVFRLQEKKKAFLEILAHIGK